MKQKKNRIGTHTAALLCSLLLLGTCAGSLVSCDEDSGKAPAKGTEDAVSTTDAVTEEKEEDYPYEIANVEGYTLRILNPAPFWGAYVNLDFESSSADVLDSAVHTRNRTVEERLGCTISVTEVDINSIDQTVNNFVSSDEDLYDVVYLFPGNSPSMITDGYYANLHEVEGLHLDAPWWDEYVVERGTINDALFFATGTLSLMAYDSSHCLFFNEDMLARYDLDKPYDLVREGKWTVDAMLTYQKDIVNLNGDASFTKWDMNGKSIYGVSVHPGMVMNFVWGNGGFMAETDKDGIIRYTAGDESFMRALDGAAKLLSLPNGYGYNASTGGTTETEGGYMDVFTSERSLFVTAQVKNAQGLRDWEPTFGILPMPKLDENQESYITTTGCIYFTVPKTNSHLTETGTIADVLSWQSLKDVYPEFVGKTVEQKGLRNPDSIEMLSVIRSGMTLDPAGVFGWAGVFYDGLTGDLLKKLYEGNGGYTSVIERHRKKVEASIEQVMDAIADLDTQ